MKKLSMFASGLLFLSAFIFNGYLCASTPRIQHVIKENNKVNCEIVAPPEAGPVAAFAAKELKKFLSRSLDSDIQINKSPSGNKTAIILGRSELLKKAGVDIDKLPRDGFIIKSVGNNIFIAGKDDLSKDPEKQLKGGAWAQFYERGTLFGAYDFLERFLGIRFYFPGEMGVVVPKHEDLKLPSLDIVEKPDYTVRNVSSFIGKTPDGLEEKESWPYKNLNYSRLRMQTKYIPNCHGLSLLGFIERFGKSHPEYFALMSDGKRYNNPAFRQTGQLCFSSGIKEEIYKDAVAFLTGKSAKSRDIKTKYGQIWDPTGFQKGYFNVMPQDGFYQCRCAECQKHFQKGPKATSEFIWDFVCDTAERLKKDNIPGYITMMAYPPYRIIPDRKLPDNVLVMVAERGPWNMHVPVMFEKDEKEIKDWFHKQGKKVWLWNYANKFGKLEMPGIPSITPKCIGEYYKLQKPYIFGAYMESETDRTIYHYLNFYIFSKVCWDNSTDVDGVLKEHYRKMFGKAAPLMEKAYNIFEAKWLEILGEPISTQLGPSCYTASDYELWEKIYSQAEIESIDKLFAESEKITMDTPEENARVKFMREQLLGPLKKQRASYLKNKQEISDLQFHVKKVPEDLKINIDGKGDDIAWSHSDKIFLRPFAKEDKQKSVVKTVVRALKDKNNLYFLFECSEPQMNKIITTKRKYDDHDIWRDSSVEIFLNPSGDRKEYYHIIVNASGSMADSTGKKMGAEQMHDWNWNSEALASVKRDRNSWTAEVAVPLKNRKDCKAEGFPANFNRTRILADKSKDYVSLFTWSPFLKKGFHEIENFGSIKFNMQENKNIIKNSDFTEDANGRFLGGWYAPQAEKLKNGESWEIVSDTFMKGGKSIMLKSPGKGKIFVAQYLPDLKPDTEYLLTFFIKTENIVNLCKEWSGACVNIWDDRNRWFPINFYSGTMPWTKQGFKFKSNPNTNKKPHRSYMMLYLLNASGAVWFDDVRLRELPRQN